MFGAAALPGLAWLLSTVLWLTGLSLGSDRLFPSYGDVTLSEAAALGDRLLLEQLIEDGADPNAATVLREGWLDDRRHLLTPVEAAIAAGNDDLVRRLVELGARLPPGDP